MIFLCSLGSVLAADTSLPPPKNVLLLCIDDLRPELNCFGVEYIHSPNIDRLAAKGRPFDRHFVNAPSCGPSRYTLLTGRYGPAGNMALFQRARQMEEAPGSVPPSMPEWFRQNGYTTVSVGKVSHHPGGLGGKYWNDPNVIEMPRAWDRQRMPVGEWQHPRGAMHGLAHGNIRDDKKGHPVFETMAGPDTIYNDGLITETGLGELERLAGEGKPFFLAIGLIKPHLPFGAPEKYFDLYDGKAMPSIPHPEKPSGMTTWHGSGEFMRYDRWGRDPRSDSAFADDVRRHYAACVSYADAQVGRILAKLETTGALENTIVILWGDHGWHLGEHAIWGKHALFEESLRSPLIISYPGMDHPGKASSAIVETSAIFPTLCELAGIPLPGYTVGKSLVDLLQDPARPGRPAVAYIGKAQTIRSDRYRLIVHDEGMVELYDHASPEAETRNVAEEFPEAVEELRNALQSRLGMQ